MKAEIKTPSERPARPFPKLMQSKAGALRVLFFHSPSKGIVLSAASGVWVVGDYSANWNMDAFKDFEGSITLENDH